MKIFKRISLLLLTAFFIQCTNKEESEYMPPGFSLKEERKITVLNNDFIIGTGTLHVIDSFLIVVAETDINKKQLHIFNKFNGKYLKSIGKSGQGPGELTIPVNRVTIDNRNKKIYIYDLGKSRLVSFDLNTLMEDKEIEGVEENFPETMQSHLELAYLGNDEFLVAYPTKNRFRFIKGNKTDTVATYSSYPGLSEPREYKHIEESYFFYSSHITTSPDGKKLANATSAGCLLELFDISENKIEHLYTKRFYEPDYYVTDKNEKFPYIRKDKCKVMGITVVKSTDKYIYALLDESNGKGFPNIISVFDWKGKPVKQYVLDCRIFTFCIDEAAEKGYVLSMTEEDINLVQFDL